MTDFEKIFESLAYRHNYMTVFDDFLTASISALAMGQMEKDYEQAMKAYNQEEKKLFGHLFGAMVNEYEKRSNSEGTWYDMLGNFFEEHNGKWGRDANGQFFTPPQLSDLMAQLTYDQNQDSEYITDPACGSGRCLISLDRTNSKNRFNHFYVGSDVDIRCVKMCTINFFMFGMKGAVIHMNSLSLEIWGGYRVFLPDTYLGIRPLSKSECYQYIFATKYEDPKPEIKQVEKVEVQLMVKQPLPAEKPKQLSLF